MFLDCKSTFPPLRPKLAAYSLVELMVGMFVLAMLGLGMTKALHSHPIGMAVFFF